MPKDTERLARRARKSDRIDTTGFPSVNRASLFAGLKEAALVKKQQREGHSGHETTKS